MKFIPNLVTSRINAEIKELSIGAIIDLCNTPVEYNEQGITKTLVAIVADTNLPIEQWTAQERYAAVLHYYYNTNFKDADAIVDDESGAKIDDYLLKDRDYPVPAAYSLNKEHPRPWLSYNIELDAESDTPDSLWMLPLTGTWMEAVERVVLGGYIKNITDKAEIWRIATAAAQILPRGIDHEEALAKAGVSVDKYLLDNINLILDLSETHYNELMQAFDEGTQHLDHIVALRLSSTGFCLECQKGGVDGMPSFRFLFDAILSRNARQLWQRNA